MYESVFTGTVTLVYYNENGNLKNKLNDYRGDQGPKKMSV